MSVTGGHGSGSDPDLRGGEDAKDSLLQRFASVEARRVVSSTAWFLLAGVAAIAIEILVVKLEEYPKLWFVTDVLDWLGKLVLVCDAVVFALFIVVASLLAVNTLLGLVGIQVIPIARWVGRQIGRLFRRKGKGGGGGPVPVA